MKNSFRSFYISALAVAGIGFIGASCAPRAHVGDSNKPTVMKVNGVDHGGQQNVTSRNVCMESDENDVRSHHNAIFDNARQAIDRSFTFKILPAAAPLREVPHQ